MIKIKIKLYEFNLLIICILFNVLIYNGSRIISENSIHYSMMTIWDYKIPFIPAFVIIYIGCYLFWAFSYIHSVSLNKYNAERFVFAHIIGETICFLIFILYPTEIERPIVLGNSLFDYLTKIVYKYDEANNLFPSIHCFVSWLCVVDARNNINNNKVLFFTALILAILVCISTVTLKQHVIVDVFAGIILAEISYILSREFTKKLYYYFEII